MIVTIVLTLLGIVAAVALWILLEVIGALFAITFGLGGILFRLIFYVVRVFICTYVVYYILDYVYKRVNS
jgi:hypothetical protein